MGSSLHLFLFMHILFLSLSCFHLIIIMASSLSVEQPLCHADESSALLQFKQSFSIDESASSDPSSYPKIASWKLKGDSGDCCSWAGVECDQETGHVIGLDLSSSLLHGSINSSSSLFSLVHLQRLNLADNDFDDSHIPSEIGHLSGLTSLNFSYSIFSGEFPISIFYLPNLQVLDVSSNRYLTGHLPEFHPSSSLQHLMLSYTSFSGKLPDSIGNLYLLNRLDLSDCHFSGSLPPSLGNLTQLHYMSLSSNKFNAGIPPLLGKLTELTFLDLSDLNLYGSIPNNFTVSSKTTSNYTLPKLKVLILDTCNLMEFPNFLRFQDKLEVLSLVGNKIYGQIPAWMLNTSVETLEIIRFQYNFLTGFEQHPNILPWDNLIMLHLSHNMINGPLPIPPLSTQSYRVAYNGLTGELPPLICQLNSLYALDLSNNNLTGTIPPCLSNLSDSLLVLNLKDNNFQGPIPHSYKKGNKLKMIDFSGNKLQGKVPRSLASCTELGILDLSHNLIEDTFPFWLGDLTKLQVLILRSNKFYGAIESPKIKLGFPNLRIIDLSHNGFTGNLPAKYFQNWIAMKFFDVNNTTYMYAPIESPQNFSLPWISVYYFEMNITIKGVNLEYKQILNIFTAIDLSSNKFEGEIPEFIGHLKGLQALNLSNNDLSGRIPSCFGNLTNLESLDLSQNKLLGEIPQQLALLTFLEFLNVSNNNLTGPIPHGKQLNTFENNSYEGNLGLCGDPLSRKCGKPKAPALNFEEENDSTFPSTVDWIVICMGYVSGIVVGIVIGHTITTRYHEWFIETFGRKQHKPRRQKRGHGNRS